MDVYLADHAQVSALLVLSQRETESTLSMRALAFLADHAQVSAQLALSQRVDFNPY